MVRRAAALLVLCLAAAAPAGAEPTRIEQMLATVAAGPLAGAPSHLGYIDFAALYASTGFQRGDWRSLPREQREEQEDRMQDAWLRIHTDLPFLPYLLSAGDKWPGWLGFDYSDLDWSASLGEPPGNLLYLGFEAPPAAAIEAALLARGLSRDEVDGVPVFARGKEGSHDLKNPQPGYPFWGELGSAERLALLPHALAGSRFAAVTREAVAGPRLDSLPAVVAAFAAAEGAEGADRAPLLQATLVREDFSPDYVKALLPAGTSIEQAQAALEAQAPGPLPAFDLLLIADRQGAAGDEALVALVYGSADDAAVAADTLPRRLAVFRPQMQNRTLPELLGAEVTVAVVAQGGRSVVVLRFLPDPAAVEDRPAAYAYRVLMRGLFSRDLDWLTWK